MIVEDCIHYNDGLCIDGQECNVTTINVKNKKCFVSRFALTDCMHFKKDKPQCERCGVLLPNKYGLAPCSDLKLGKSGKRKVCTFYDNGGGCSRKIPIEEVDISVRACKCLKRAGINTIEDLEEYSENDLKRVRNLGQQCLYEVLEICKVHGVNLKEE